MSLTRFSDVQLRAMRLRRSTTAISRAVQVKRSATRKATRLGRLLQESDSGARARRYCRARAKYATSFYNLFKFYIFFYAYNFLFVLFLTFFLQTFDKNVFGLLQSIKQREDGGKQRQSRQDKSAPDSTPSVRVLPYCVVLYWNANSCET